MIRVGQSTSAPSSMTLKRLHREIADLKKEDLGGITLGPSENSMFEWEGVIPGPEGSVYEGGAFKIAISLPTDYPFHSPKVVFKTRIYHMNISDVGYVCLDILKHAWSPALSIYKVVLSLSSLLTDPNPKDPLVATIANEYTRQRAKHDATARQWTTLYALPTPPPATSSSKGKNKAKDTQPAAPASSSNASSSEPIIIPSDDEDEPSRPTTRAGAKRKRGAQEGRTAKRRATAGDEEVIVIEDD